MLHHLLWKRSVFKRLWFHCGCHQQYVKEPPFFFCIRPWRRLGNDSIISPSFSHSSHQASDGNVSRTVPKSHALQGFLTGCLKQFVWCYCKQQQVRPLLEVSFGKLCNAFSFSCILKCKITTFCNITAPFFATFLQVFHINHSAVSAGSTAVFFSAFARENSWKAFWRQNW